ncbi:hypothetical protein Tco_0026562 [Tanacetum coccineum]
MMPPPGFSTPPQIPNVNTSERPHIRNEDLRTEQEYFSEDYDEEREMEPRLGRTKEATPSLQTRSLEVRRQRERVVGFEEAPNREGSRAGRNAKDQRSPPGTITEDRKAGIAKTFEQPPRLPGNKWSRDRTKYCHFHKDHGHDTNQCWELKHQIEEAVKSGQLAHLVKGKKKKKGKMSDTQLGEWKKGGKDVTPVEAIILMISRKSHNMRKRPVEGDYSELKTSIRSLRVDSKTPLVGFSGEQSWPLGEVPLEITIEEGPLTVTNILNIVIVRSDLPHNLLLGRTAMQQMGIIVSTIHGAINSIHPEESAPFFHNTTPHGTEEKLRITSEEHQEDAKKFSVV